MTITTTAKPVTQERVIAVMVTIRVEDAPHLLNAVDQVLTALTNAGVEPISVSAHDDDEP